MRELVYQKKESSCEERKSLQSSRSSFSLWYFISFCLSSCFSLQFVRSGKIEFHYCFYTLKERETTDVGKSTVCQTQRQETESEEEGGKKKDRFERERKNAQLSPFTLFCVYTFSSLQHPLFLFSQSSYCWQLIVKSNVRVAIRAAVNTIDRESILSWSLHGLDFDAFLCSQERSVLFLVVWH